MLTALWVYLAVINLAAFAAFVLDKRAARQRGPRVKESTLITLAASGGAPGAVLGQQLLRHKTRKRPFRGYLWTIFLIEAVVFALLFLL